MEIDKKDIIMAALLVLCGAAICFQFAKIRELAKERDKYESNTHGLLMDMETLRNDTAMKAKQIQRIALTLDEYKQYRKEDAELIKSLNIKLKNVSAVSRQKMEVSASVAAPIRDSVFIINAVPIPIQKVSFENEHISLNGQIRNDSLMANIEVPITLTQVIHKVPKHKFLWWTWGCKGIKQVITTDNPYINITYSEYIEIDD